MLVTYHYHKRIAARKFNFNNRGLRTIIDIRIDVDYTTSQEYYKLNLAWRLRIIF